MSSSASAAVASDTTSTTSNSSTSFFAALGLPLTIAVTVGFLILLAALLLASYVCCRSASHPPRLPAGSTAAAADGVALPRIIFVADDEDADSNVGGAGAGGLDHAAISSYPKFSFSAAKVGEGGDRVCSICLCEYLEEEMLRMIPDCRHCFHLMCIDVWLRLNASCPVCRTSPLPTPVSTPISTPLSELAPLSRYAADRRRRR